MKGSPTCNEVRPRLLDYQRGQLDSEPDREVLTHLEICAPCAREGAAEQALTEILERRLPQHTASFALKRRLAAQWPATPSVMPSWWNRWSRSLVPAAVVAVLLVAALQSYLQHPEVGPSGMVSEAVNDHLRVLSSQSPVDVRSGGLHQVKPWFAGRLDFAPVVRFGGDDDFPLQGGAVGYFVDRKAAVFVFNRRLHVVTLFVFPADGFAWPVRGLTPMGDTQAYATTARGFHVILWRDGELGYALVSDVEQAELTRLGVKLASGS
jgi:anti-sigma factor RsiW